MSVAIRPVVVLMTLSAYQVRFIIQSQPLSDLCLHMTCNQSIMFYGDRAKQEKHQCQSLHHVFTHLSWE